LFQGENSTVQEAVAGQLQGSKFLGQGVKFVFFVGPIISYCHECHEDVPSYDTIFSREVTMDEKIDGGKERSYRDEYSWDQLEEDEYGRLRSTVCVFLACGRMHRGFNGQILLMNL